MYRDVLLGSCKSPFQVSMLSSQVQRRRRNTTLVPGGGGDAALERSPSSLRARERQRRVVVTQEILMEALGGVRPSVSEPERNKYSKMLVLVGALCRGTKRWRRWGGGRGLMGREGGVDGEEELEEGIRRGE